MGGDRSTSTLSVIDIACDECPMDGQEVTNNCRAALPTAARTSAEGEQL